MGIIYKGNMATTVDLDERLSADNFESMGIVLLTTAVAANTKGVYSQLIASTARRYTFLLVQCRNTSAADRYLIDISTGAAGSEAVLIPDLVYDNVTAAGVETAGPSMIKCNIPAATRIAARVESILGGSASISIHLKGIG